MPESFLDKGAGFRPGTLLKKRLWHRCFPVNFVKSLRTPFLTEHLRWLLLNVELYSKNYLDQKKNNQKELIIDKR